MSVPNIITSTKSTLHYWPVFIIALSLTVLLNTGSLFFQGIRLDEAQSIWVSSKSLPELLKITGEDVQTPLYLLILHFWTIIFGSDVIVTRLLSLIFFIASLPVLYRLIVESSNHDTAVLGVVIFSFSPFILWYSQEARTYTLLTFLATLSHLYLLRFLRNPAYTLPGEFILVSTLGIYCHYFFAFFLVSQFLYLIFFVLKHRRRYYLIKFAILIFSFVIITLLFLPWLTYVYSLGFAQNTQPRLPPPNSFNLLQIYLNFLVGFLSPEIIAIAVSFWPLLLMGLFLVFTRRMAVELRPANYFVIMTFLPVFLVFALSIIKPIFLPRYLIFIAPSLFTLLAWIIANFTRKNISLPVLTILVIMALALNFQNRSDQTPVKENYRGATEYISQQATSHDIVAITTPFTIYPVEYYYSGTARIVTIPYWNRYREGGIPAYNKNNLIQQADSYAGVYDRIFLLTSYDQGYESDVVEYFDTHYHRDEIKDFSTGVTLRVYRIGYFK